ncbi:uncharacterized protein BKA78DRAFT_30401 [Phyllosticta capitalensis]|uniref:uncharacterized protein n=1 Tax=Phyllosticta capitalensis TaxID=121624 RepID=UPI003130F21B
MRSAPDLHPRPLPLRRLLWPQPCQRPLRWPLKLLPSLPTTATNSRARTPPLPLRKRLSSVPTPDLTHHHRTSIASASPDPAMSASPKRRNLNPTVEDDDSSDEKKNGYARSNCNVAVKRSTDLGKHKLPDHTSDSGYSSRTATSKRSADSTKSSKDKTQDPAAKPETPPPAEPPVAEAKEKKKTSRDTKKPTKPVVKQESKREERPARAESKTRKSRRDSLPVATAETDPDRRRRKRLSVDTRVERPSGHGSRYHPSSSHGRTPVDHVAESGGSRPRLQPAGGRPVSYHGSSSSGYMNGSQGYFSGGPPPAMFNSPYWMPSPVAAQYSPYARPMGLPSPMTPHVDPRFPGPVIHQGNQPAARAQPRYNPRYGQPQSAISSPRQEEFDDEDACDPWDQYDRYDQDRQDSQDMPPPSFIPQRRPSAPKQTRTAPNIMPSMYPRVAWEDERQDDADDYYEEDPRLARQFAGLSMGTTRRGRSATSPDSRNTGGRAQAVIEPAQSKDNRRDHLTRRNTVYNTTVPSQQQSNNARRDRADERRKSQMDDKERRVEEYVRGMSLENPIDRLRTGSGRRAQSTASPRTRTNVSSRHGEDGKSRVSDSGTALSRKTNNLIIKVHDDNDIVEIQGDVSGKAIRFGNGEDGGKQIIIADARNKEKYYIKDSSHTTENTSSSRSRGESDRRTKVSNRTERERRPRQTEQWVQQDQWRQPDQWRGW